MTCQRTTTRSQSTTCSEVLQQAEQAAQLARAYTRGGGLNADGRCRSKLSPNCRRSADHDAMPEHLRVSVLLGAFVGLRVAEAAALRVSDVDFMRGVVKPAIQYPAEPLKSETQQDGRSRSPNELALDARGATCSSTAATTVVTNEIGRPSSPVGDRAGDPLEQEPGRRACPEGFRFHDLRHYLASLLIGTGLRRQGRPVAAAARERDDDAQHLRAPVARQRRDRTRSAIACWRCAVSPLRTPGHEALTCVSAGQGRMRIRCRSTSRTRAGAAGTGWGRPRSCASTRSRSR